jgi:post-segregation antitoxin (ccd killing protein)
MVILKIGSNGADFIISDRTINCLKAVRAALPASEQSDDAFEMLVRELVWQANKERIAEAAKYRDELGDLMQPMGIEDEVQTQVAHLLEDPSWLY